MKSLNNKLLHKTIGEILGENDTTELKLNNKYYLWIEADKQFAPDLVLLELHELNTFDKDSYIKTLLHNSTSDTLSEVLSEVSSEIGGAIL